MDEKLGKLIRSIKAVLVLREVIRTGAIGLAVAGLVIFAAAFFEPTLPRIPLLGLLALGPLLGLVLGFRRLPVVADMVLYLDRKLGAESSLITAYELDAVRRERHKTMVALAEEKLDRARFADFRPKLASPWLWALTVAAGGIAGAFLLPATAPASQQPGMEVVRLDADKLLALEKLPDEASDPEQRARLEKLAKKAAELRGELARGIEQREALDKLAKLADAVDRELGRESATQRKARDRAIDELRDEPTMAKALAERNLESLSQAVEKAAARREQADREKAQDALDRAGKAAAAAGDKALSKLLSSQKQRLKLRAKQAKLARKLLDGMPELEGLSKALSRLERHGKGAALDKALVNAMTKAWSRLTKEERETLAKAMKNAAETPNTKAGPTKADGAQKLSADEVEKMLRNALANLDKLSKQAGGSKAGGKSLPIPVSVPGQGGQSGAGNASAGATGPNPAPNSPGTGSGGHIPSKGSTQAIKGSKDMLVRVRPTPGKEGQGAPSFSTVEWVDPQGSLLPESKGASGAPGAPVKGAPGAIERSPIPESYQEHVRRYFGGEETP